MPKHDWRYAPKQIMTLRSGLRPVVRAIAHPAGSHKSAIRSDMLALQLVSDVGESSWFGVEDAKINSQLRMVVRGGFINPRNELANKKRWKPCRKACDSLSGAGRR